MTRKRYPLRNCSRCQFGDCLPAYTDIPLTHRACASSVAIVPGHSAWSNPDQIKWSELARSVDTLVILMGLHNLKEIMTRLLADGCEPRRPAALIQSGTRPSQKSVVGTIATIADLAERERFQSPTVIVVGGSGEIGSGFALVQQGCL